MKLIYLVALISAIVFFGFPILTLHVIKKTYKANDESDKKGGYAELKASILFLQMAFPAILTILGALGYGLYEGTVQKVTSAVQAKVDTLIEKKKIVEWTKEIEKYRNQAEENANFIKAISEMDQDTILIAAKKAFLQILPKGTIIPFSGRKSEIDTVYWAICDGRRGTPDLRDRFIYGGNFIQVGSRGGSLSHSHSATTIPRGQVSKREKLNFPHFEGNIKQFFVEQHEHSFNGVQSPVKVDKSDHLPPFYRLVFLMKIK